MSYKTELEPVYRTYTIKAPSKLLPSAEQVLGRIIFKDKEFSHCEFKGKNPYSREDWKMLAFIEKSIGKIEKELANGK